MFYEPLRIRTNSSFEKQAYVHYIQSEPVTHTVFRPFLADSVGTSLQA